MQKKINREVINLAREHQASRAFHLREYIDKINDI
jgi:hypothetical protein